MQSSQLDPVRAAMAPLQAQNFGAYLNEWVPKQESLRVLLNDLGIQTPMFFQYEALAGEYYHAWKSQAGTSIILEFSNIRDKYVALGCADAPCIDIAEQIFNVTVPVMVP